MPLPQMPTPDSMLSLQEEQKKFIYLTINYSKIDVILILFYIKNDLSFFANKITREALFHRLSGKLQPLGNDGIKCSRSSIEEYKMCIKYKRSFFNSIRSVESFLKYIKEISSDLLGNPVFIREKEVIVTPDRYGNFVAYPNQKYINFGIEKLLFVIKNKEKYGALLSSCTILSMLLSIHPFQDGNGRVSRIIFNIFLMNTVNKNIFIPIYEFSKISQNGFLFNIREAQLFNKWENISIYMNNILLESIKFNMNFDNIRSISNGKLEEFCYYLYKT